MISAEIGQDSYTRIDRAMAGEAEDRFPDLCHEPADHRRQLDRTLRLRRLAKLEKMGLATEHAPGVWEWSERMEPALRELGPILPGRLWASVLSTPTVKVHAAPDKPARWLHL